MSFAFKFLNQFYDARRQTYPCTKKKGRKDPREVLPRRSIKSPKSKKSDDEHNESEHSKDKENKELGFKFEYFREHVNKEFGFKVEYTRDDESIEYVGNKNEVYKLESLIKNECIKTSTENSLVHYVKLIGFLIPFLIPIFIFLYKQYPESPVTNREETWIDDLKLLRTKYKNQVNNTWFEVFAGLSYQDAPSVLILLDNHDQTTRCLAQDLGNLVTKMYTRDTEISTSILEADDVLNNYQHFGEVIDNYKSLVSQTHSLVVFNLESFVGDWRHIFHTICDGVTPFVDKAAYFLTLKNDNQYSELRVREKAVRILQDVWKDFPEDCLLPTIARITGRVVEIHPEPNSVC